MNNQLEKECKHRKYTHKNTFHLLFIDFETLQNAKPKQTFLILIGIFEIKPYDSSGIVRNLRV